MDISGQSWAPRNMSCPEARKENALTIPLIMNNFHYLINKVEDRWTAVIGIVGNWGHMGDVGRMDNKMMPAPAVINAQIINVVN